MPGFSLFTISPRIDKVNLSIQEQNDKTIWNYQTTDYLIENVERTLEFLQKQTLFEGQEEGSDEQSGGLNIYEKTRIIFYIPRHLDYLTFISSGNIINFSIMKENGDLTRYCAMLYPYSIFTTQKPFGKYVKLYKMRGLDPERTCIEEDIILWFHDNRMIISQKYPSPSTESGSTTKSGENEQ